MIQPEGSHTSDYRFRDDVSAVIFTTKAHFQYCDVDLNVTKDVLQWLTKIHTLRVRNAWYASRFRYLKYMGFEGVLSYFLYEISVVFRAWP